MESANVLYLRTRLFSQNSLARSFCENKLARTYHTSVLSMKKSIYLYHQSRGMLLQLLMWEKLQKTYGRMCAARRILHIPSFCDKFKHLLYKDCRYTSDFTAHQQVSTVFLQWFDDYSGPAVIPEFLQHDVVVEMGNSHSCLSWVVCRTSSMQQIFKTCGGLGKLFWIISSWTCSLCACGKIPGKLCVG